MNFNSVSTTMKKAVWKTNFQLRKHSPEILAAAGVVGIVTSVVMACKATTKISEILEETRDTIDIIHEKEHDPELNESGTYNPEIAKKDLTIVYAQTGFKLFRLYAPSVILGVMSIGSMLASNNILRKRNVALAAAYTTIDKSFKKYRNNVVERFGETVDKELKYGIKAKKVEETEVNPETGKEKKTKKSVDIATGIDERSEYGRFFDEASPCWEKDAEANLMFLRAQERYANDLLQSRGHLFLNEVYRMLGIPISKAGQVIGWIYDPKNSELNNYVDFGIYNINREKSRDFVNGYERSIFLDFNVDGNIWDLMY